MHKRKTIEVEMLKVKVNAMLKDSTCDPQVRLGMCSVLESALHATGNYSGFRYLLAGEVPKGHKEGVRYDEKRMILPYPDRFKDTDESRRMYF